MIFSLIVIITHYLAHRNSETVRYIGPKSTITITITIITMMMMMMVVMGSFSPLYSYQLL